MSDHSSFENPLVTRYAGPDMVALWSPQRKFSIWRRLWLALAEAQFELALPEAGADRPRIRKEQLDELRQHLDDIDFDAANRHERRVRHDVMAQIHALAEVAPNCADIIHLGATSCFVTDNADLILLRESLQLIRDRVLGVIELLGEFAMRNRDLPTVGFTHFQPAQLTTVGKRATLWCYDFVLDLEEVERRIAGLKFRGAKGTTGTQASFLALFRGDHAKVQMLDQLVARKMEFDSVLPVTGQTYSRKIDSQVLDCLAGISHSASKFANDLRLLSHEREIDEPFGPEQVGSSAMAYKKNPMLSERVCSISRFVAGLPAMAGQTAANQWLERTLDDSAARRLYLPQSFLGVDAILRLVGKIAKGLEVNAAVIARNVAVVLPYIATENILMAVVAAGGNRQTAHERIRFHSQQVTANLKAGAMTNDLIDRLKADREFANVEMDALTDSRGFVGRAVEQVDEFNLNVIESIRRNYPHRPHSNDDIEV